MNDLIKNLSREDLIRQSSFSKLDPTRAKTIITEGVSKQIKRTIENIMDTNYYHLIIDEVSDRYGTGYLGISVRFLDNSTPITRFYRLIKLDTDSSGKELYDILCETILLNDIRKNNLIALCTDGASNMCGENKGVATRIAQVVPHLFWLHCTSHCFNLIIEKASSACLGDIISLVKEITSNFSFSNISHAILHEIQREGEVKERKKSFALCANSLAQFG